MVSMTLSDLWPGFQGHEKTAPHIDKVTIARDESIHKIWNDTMFGDLV